MKIEEARRVVIDFSGPPEALHRLVAAFFNEHNTLIPEPISIPNDSAGRMELLTPKPPVWGTITYHAEPAERQ